MSANLDCCKSLQFVFVGCWKATEKMPDEIFGELWALFPHVTFGDINDARRMAIEEIQVEDAHRKRFAISTNNTPTHTGAPKQKITVNDTLTPGGAHEGRNS